MDTNILTPDQLEKLVAILVRIGIALVIFVIGWIVSKWVNALVLRAVRSSRMDEALARFFASLAQYAVLAFAAIAALDKAGVETASFAVVIGAAGLAIGLALQGTLGNFSSGVLLLFFRYFTIGDRITVAGHTGKVEDLGLFATTLTTPANERIIIPNGEVFDDAITNHTATGVIRATIGAGVAYGADIDQVVSLLLQAAKAAQHVLDDPEPTVVFTEMAASSVNFAVHCWTEPKNFVVMQHDVRREIYNHLNAAGIEIPFNQLVLHKASDAAS